MHSQCIPRGTGDYACTYSRFTIHSVIQYKEAAKHDVVSGTPHFVTDSLTCLL